MKELLTPKNLQETYLDWTIIDPLLYARKLNQILRTDEIRRLFHEVTRTYEAIRRWEILEWKGFDYYPKLIKRIGRRGVSPVPLSNVHSMDWDDGLPPGPGRPALSLGLRACRYVLSLESQGLTWLSFNACCPSTTGLW